MKKINTKNIVTDSFIDEVKNRLNEIVNNKKSTFYKLYSLNSNIYENWKIKEWIFLSLLKWEYKNINHFTDSQDIKKVNSIFSWFYETFRNEFWSKFVKLFYENWIRVCPYCNINTFDYIYTIKKKLAPTIDHVNNKAWDWINNSINLYNMLPACYTCNSKQLKWELDFPNNTNLLDNDWKWNDIYDKFYFKIKSKTWIIQDIFIWDNFELEIITKKWIPIDANILAYLDINNNIDNKVSFAIKQRIESNNYLIKDFFLNIYAHNNLFSELVINKLVKWKKNNFDNLYIKNYKENYYNYKEIHKLSYSKLFLDINEIYFNNKIDSLCSSTTPQNLTF